MGLANNKQFEIMVSGVAPELYPTDTYFGLLWYNAKEEALEIPKRYPYKGEWGGCITNCISVRDKYPMPHMLSLVWLSIVERKFYAIEEPFPLNGLVYLWEESKNKNDEYIFSHIVVGMAPYGQVALWFYGEKKSKLLAWLYADETTVSMEDFAPTQPDITLDQVCDFYINSAPAVKENLEQNGLPPRDLFDKYMQQFHYRYVVEFGRWSRRDEEWKEYKEGDEIPVFDYIEESLFDGTHDKLRDGGLMDYHDAGKPKKLAVAWHIGKSDYQAYFWMDEHLIRSAFEQVFGTQTDCPTDFHVHIDPKKNEYQLSLHQQNMEDPYMLPKEAYELIVFKSKFEHYRSKNYNQNPGAWIW